MEVKIGVQYSPRELVLEITSTPAEIDTLVAEALGSDSGLLRIADDKGRTVMVPASKIAYVECQETPDRRIGFTA